MVYCQFYCVLYGEWIVSVEVVSQVGLVNQWYVVDIVVYVLGVKVFVYVVVEQDMLVGVVYCVFFLRLGLWKNECSVGELVLGSIFRY